MTKDEQLTLLLEFVRDLAKDAGDVVSADEEFVANDFAGGNIDDAWYGGMTDGYRAIGNQALHLLSVVGA